MPKFRIQSFSGKWQLCQLNDICSRKSIKNKDNLYSRVLTIAAQHGLVDQESYFKKRVAGENLESYLCLEKGDFAYNKSYSSDYPTKFGASPPSLTAENPVVFSEHHHPKTLKTL